MVRSRTGTPGGGRAGRWLGVAVTALLTGLLALAAAGPARADAGPARANTDRVAGIGIHFATAESQPSAKTVTAPYTCDFGSYGSGIAAATVDTQYAVPDSWPVNNPAPIVLDSQPLSLPAQVSSQLADVTDFEVQATVQAQHATAATVTVAGDSTDTLPNPPTQVPEIISEGQVTFPAQGTGTVSLPPATLVITPFANETSEPTITCTTTTAAGDVSIAIGKATGPFYKCTITGGQAPVVVSGLINMSATASGNTTVGSTDTVTLSSTDLADLVTGLPSGTEEDFSGSLPVQGAQSGSVPLTGTITTPASGPLTATGTLALSKTGTIHLLIPQTFTISFSVQGAAFTIGCDLQTSPPPTALNLSVTNGSGSATTTGSGTPAGAPATGGGAGPVPGSTPALAGAGTALIAAGGALLLWARRRRAGELLAVGSRRWWRRRSS